MAIKPKYFSSYTPSCLSAEHYRVYQKGNNEVYLRFDTESGFRYDDSVGEILASVEAYEKSSFLARWRRRLSTPIGSNPIQVEQQKLLWICEYFWHTWSRLQAKAPEGLVQPETPEAGSVLDRLLKRAESFSPAFEKRLAGEEKRGRKKSIRWLGLGKTHKFLSGDVHSIWQGILFFMRSLFSRKKTYTEEELELKGAKTKHALHALYADAADQLTKSYFSGKAESPRDWPRIVEQAEKDLKARKEELRGDFRNEKHWSVPDSPSEGDLKKTLEMQNTSFDLVEAIGQESIDEAKAKIEAFEAIRLSLTRLEKEAKIKAKQLGQLNSGLCLDAKRAKLSQEHIQLRSRSFGSILFSSESQYLQSKHGISIDFLRAFFSDHQNRINQPLSELDRKICKKMDSNKQPPLHVGSAQRYQEFLENALEAFLLKDSESLKKAEAKIEEEWVFFSDSLSSDENYKAQCLPEWTACVEEIKKALALSENILKKHEHYQLLFENTEALADFLGFAPAPARYQQLAQAHANGLREIMASSHSKQAYAEELSEKVEKCISDFSEKLKASEKAFCEKYPLSCKIVHHRAPENKALTYAHIYEGYVLQFLHKAYAELQLNKDGREFSNFINVCSRMRKTLWEQLLEELRDLSGMLNDLECRTAFEKLTLPWRERIREFFKSLRSQADTLRPLIQNSSSDLRNTLFESPSFQEGLENFQNLSQEMIFGKIQEEILLRKENERVGTDGSEAADVSENANAELQDIPLESDLEQLQVDCLNRRVLSTKDVNDFLLMKTHFSKRMEVLPRYDLKTVIAAFEDLKEEWRVLALKNMRSGLKDPDVLSRLKQEEGERALRKAAGDDYIPHTFKNFRLQIEISCEKKIEALKKEMPKLGVFIQRYLQWSCECFLSSTVKLQESTLMFYEKNPSSLQPLEEDSELFAWIKKTGQEYQHLIENKIVECLELEVEDPLREIRAFRDEQQQYLCERLYRRLAKESPVLQFQGLSFAQKLWDKDWRDDSKHHIIYEIGDWREAQASYLDDENKEWLVENAECPELLSRLLREKHQFWSQDWSKDQSVFERLLRWQRAALRRTTRMKSDVAQKAKIEKIQKNLKKMLNNFLLVYHPDKHAEDKEKQKFLSDKLLQFRAQVEDLIEKGNTPKSLLAEPDDFPIRRRRRFWEERSCDHESSDQRQARRWDELCILREKFAQFWAEQAQRDAEHAQFDAEQAQRDAEHAQFDAEQAQFKAEQAQFKAEQAQFKAEQAQRDAEHAQFEAEIAQIEEEIAQIKKETEVIEKRIWEREQRQEIFEPTKELEAIKLALQQEMEMLARGMEDHKKEALEKLREEIKKERKEKKKKEKKKERKREKKKANEGSPEVAVQPGTEASSPHHWSPGPALFNLPKEHPAEKGPNQDHTSDKGAESSPNSPSGL